MEYTPRSHFVPFHNRKQRWAVLCTHRRAGKTVALINDLIIGALECQLHRPQLAYVGPTYKQAKRVAWPYLKEYATPYLADKPSESELSVTLHGGRKIFCLGADNPDSLRGMYLDGGVGDEYALFKPSVYTTIIRPALSDRNVWWVFTSSPRGKNLFYDELRRATNNPEEYYSLVLKASLSRIIPEAELEELRGQMDAEEFAQEYECSFDAALKGAIYASELNQAFAESRVRKDLYDDALPVHVAFDLGFTDSTVATYWQVGPDGTIRVVRVHATTGTDIFTHIEELHNLTATLGDIWLPHDARAKNLQTGLSMIEQFLKEGLRPRIVPNHKIRDRLAATRRLFPSIWFDEVACQDMLEALKGYRRQWNDKLLRFDDAPYHDWCSDYADSFGYMAMVCAPAATQSVATASKFVQLGYSLDQLYENQPARTRNRRVS